MIDTLHFAMLLQNLRDASAPETRAHRHLLYLDTHELYEFAARVEARHDDAR